MKDIEGALTTALNKTGFPFEHFAFETAQRHGWTTRANRLYVDPEEGKPREMDLLCYRLDKGAEVNTCTAILISCKARTTKPWALLTRSWPSRYAPWDPYPPVPVWTNSEPLRCEVERPSWGLDYFNLADASGLASWASDSPRSVFALQEFEFVNSNRGSATALRAIGDTSLYAGVMSLLNALHYELKELPARRGNAREKLVYQFNLVQLLDGEMYEAAFERDKCEVRKVDRYRYFARTMLGNRDFAARVEFCTRAAFDNLMAELSKVHQFNRLHFESRVRDFYEGLFRSSDRLRTATATLEARLTVAVMVYGSLDAEPSRGWLGLQLETDSTLRLSGFTPFPRTGIGLRLKPGLGAR